MIKLIESPKRNTPPPPAFSVIYRREKAFTLIELLVVVLIIGILATIALSQYTKSIEKTRISQGIVLVKAMLEAQNRYFLENNSYAASIEELDVNILPEGFSKCNFISGSDLYSDGKNQIYLSALHFAYGNIHNVSPCTITKEDWAVAVNVPGYRACPANSTSPCMYCAGFTSKGKAACATFGKYVTTINTYDYYQL